MGCTERTGTIAKRRTGYSGRTASEMLTSSEWSAVADAPDLPPRQLQVVQGIINNWKESRIALDLGISKHTVHSHRRKLYAKLGVSSQVELLVLIFAVHRQIWSSEIDSNLKR